MPLIPCHDCNGCGYFVLGDAGPDEGRYAGDCEWCGGSGEVEQTCRGCDAPAEYEYVDADGDGYCHECCVAHFRFEARRYFRIRAAVALPEAAE